jgi:hypothetical protein
MCVRERIGATSFSLIKQGYSIKHARSGKVADSDVFRLSR